MTWVADHIGDILWYAGQHTLLAGIPEQHNVWMSHGDAVNVAPAGARVTAHSPGAPVAAFECPERRMAGVQYHPEASPGPNDASYLFDRFCALMQERRRR